MGVATVKGEVRVFKRQRGEWWRISGIDLKRIVYFQVIFPPVEYN